MRVKGSEDVGNEKIFHRNFTRWKEYSFFERNSVTCFLIFFDFTRELFALRILGEKKEKRIGSSRSYARNSYQEWSKERGTSWILSFASPCMHRYQAAHVCTVCYAHARNALRTPSNRKPPVFQFMSRPRTVWTPVVFEILVEAFVVRGIGRARVFAFPPRILFCNSYRTDPSPTSW